MKKMGRSPREGISQLGFEAKVEVCWALKKKKKKGWDRDPNRAEIPTSRDHTHTLSKRTMAGRTMACEELKAHASGQR